MPRSAIATGHVDDVLPPALMPAALLRYLAEGPAKPGDPSRHDLAQIVSLLRTHARRDFRGFRTSMIMRRVKRRMGLRHLHRGAGYVEYLRTHPEEVEALGKDLSIVVTAFFREPAAFQVLAQEVIPELLRRSAPADGSERAVRVWVPGCATGEEAYSIAMLFLEQFAARAAAGAPSGLRHRYRREIARAPPAPASIPRPSSPTSRPSACSASSSGPASSTIR